MTLSPSKEKSGNKLPLFQFHRTTYSVRGVALPSARIDPAKHPTNLATPD